MKAVLPASISRRGFLKNSIAGAAVFGVAPHLFLPKSAAGFREGGCPHPNIDGLRVVGVHDPGMTSEIVPVCPWTHQEGLVVARAVEENMDRMAMALTGEKQVRDAWKAILLKPPGKAWSDVVVAIKTNNIARQHTRSAVMAKMCRVLVEELNVGAHQIRIYDGKHGADLTEKTPFSGLPEGCRIVGQWGGIETPVPVPAPWRGGNNKADCLTNLATGEVDILINIALCKGHGDKFGGFTMSMKNHLGIFQPELGSRLRSHGLPALHQQDPASPRGSEHNIRGSPLPPSATLHHRRTVGERRGPVLRHLVPAQPSLHGHLRAGSRLPGGHPVSQGDHGVGHQRGGNGTVPVGIRFPEE